MEMKPNPRALATRRLRGPLLVCLALAACGEDGVVVTDVSDQSDAQVGDTTLSWSVAFTSPTDGALFGQNTPIPVAVALSGVDPSQALSFRATITLNNETIAGGSDVPFDAQGRLVREIASAGPGAHTLKVTVTGSGGTASAERSFSVNGAPEVSSLRIEPLKPNTRQDLTAVAESNDPTYLGEGVTFKYRWRKVGAAANLPSTTNVLSNIHTEKGDQIEVFVTPNDGFVDGPELRREVTIANAAPSCTGVLMLPSALNVGQSVSCSCVGWDDADGDSDQSTCVFRDTASGAVLETDGACTLEGAKVEAGMTIACALTPHDGDDAGTVVSTPSGGEVSVLNSRPSAPVATLSPAAGNALTAFTCELTSPGVDPDGDSVTHTSSWTVAGAAVASEATTATGVELGAGKGDALCCKIAASDGSTPSVSNPSCVTLENAPPPEVNVFARVRGGGSASRRSTLDCEAEGASDPDGDAITISYAWFVGGAQIPGANGASLSAASIPRDSVVSCQATICDDAGLCTVPIASKTSVLIQNALPQVGDVQIVPNEAESHPGQTLTCAFSGWDDPDGDASQVVYQWVLIVNGVETVLASETSPDIEVEVSMAPGSQLVCRVTPMNGSLAGPTSSSLPRLIGEAIPVAPTVTVHAPAGANGTLTCQTTVAGQFIPEGATWTWRWSRNGVAIDVPSSTTLAGSAVSDCDLVRCWVEIRAPGLTLDSNQGSALMPLGNDCDDGNPCTLASCRAGGGCNQVVTAGASCEDGDPCSPSSTCDPTGACIASSDICIEDALDVVTDNTIQWVGLGGLPSGGYVARFGFQRPRMRLTDEHDSRIFEEHTYDTDAQEQFRTRPAVANGKALLTHWIYASTNDNLNRYLIASIVDVATGVVEQTRTILHRYRTSVQTYDKPFEAESVSLAFSDGSWGIVANDTWYALPLVVVPAGPAQQGIRYFTWSADLATLSPATTLVSQATSTARAPFDARLVPDGSDRFIVIWTNPAKSQIYAQIYAKSGAAALPQNLTVATLPGGGIVDRIRVLPLRNGAFWVAWSFDGADLEGHGIRLQRFTPAGAPDGDAITATLAESGDQRLGDLDAFSDYGVVMVYSDSRIEGTTTANGIAAQLFTASGAFQGQPFLVNSVKAGDQVAPSVVTLPGGEWVVAWTNDTDNRIWTRRFDRAGVRFGTAFEVLANEGTFGNQADPAVASLFGGEVMVAFQSDVFGDPDMVCRVFDEDGVPRSGDVAASTHGSGAQIQAAVTGGMSRFVVAWNSAGQDGSVDGVYARWFDADGVAVGGEVQVHQVTAGAQRDPALAATLDDDVLVAWTSDADGTSFTDVKVRAFTSAGAANGAEVLVNSTTAAAQEAPAVAAFPGVRTWVVGWQSRNQDGAGNGVYLRKVVVGPSGDVTFPTGELRANQTVAGDQQAVSVAVSSIGVVAACWESFGQDGSTAASWGVYCRVYNGTTLAPLVAELRVHTIVQGDQRRPRVSALSDGRFAVVWETAGLDGRGTAIQGAIFDSGGVLRGARMTMNRWWDGEQTLPAVTSTPGAMVVGWQSGAQDQDGSGTFLRFLPME